MTSQDFSLLYLRSASALNEKIQEFEYRKAGIFTFFERCCAKKTPEKRRDVFFCLKNADWDFDEGVFNGHDARRSFDEIKHLGFSKEWAESLKYAYWFSTSKERHAFKNHVVSGVVASRPELQEQKPQTDYQQISTPLLGNSLLLAQNTLTWTKKDALTFIAQKRLAPADPVIQVLHNAQKVTDEEGLKAGIYTIVSGLMPYFFRSEQNEFSKNKSTGPSYEVLQSIVQKKTIVEPFLNGYAWLFLTQGKFYQGLEMRKFIEHYPQRRQQMLLGLHFGCERTERE